MAGYCERCYEFMKVKVAGKERNMPGGGKKVLCDPCAINVGVKDVKPLRGSRAEYSLPRSDRD